MYVPKSFEQSNIAEMHALLAAHPLATLVSLDNQRLNANHIPLEILPDPGPLGTLAGHVARANALGHSSGNNAEVLAIFHGEQSYISPSWYPTKAITHKAVPTWNYVVVHAYGKLRTIDDRQWLMDHLSRVVAKQEAIVTPPWSLGEAPEEFVGNIISGIVGIEITLTELVGKWKVSQNRPNDDKAGVAAELQKLGLLEMASQVEKYIEK